MNLFDFTSESEARKKTLNPFGAYLEKNTDRFVSGAKENLPTPRAKNVRKEYASDTRTEEKKKKPSFSDYLSETYGGYETPSETRYSSVPESGTSADDSVGEAVPTRDTSFAGAMGRSAKDIAQSFGAVASQAPRILGNVSSVPLDIVGGRYFGKEVPQALELAKTIREGGEKITSKAGDVIGLDEDRKKIASTTTDMAIAFAPGMGTTIAPKTLQGVNVGKLIKLGEKANKYVSGAAKAGMLAGEGAVNAAKYSAVSRGDVTPTTTELLASGGFSVGANLVKSIPGIRKLTGKSEILNTGDDLIVDNGKIIGTSKEISDMINNSAIRLANINSTGKKGSEEIANEAKRVISGVMGVDDKAIKTSDDLLSTLKSKEEELMALKRLHNQKGEARFYADDFVDEIDVGGVKTRVNPVDEAFDALSDAGSVAKFSNEEKATINYLRDAYVNKGLNKDELDVLAGFYGRANSAYKNNQLQTSKVFGESTRNALKDKVRTLWGEDAIAPTLDEVYSNVRLVREGLDELLGKSAVQGAKTVSKPLEKAGEFIGNVTQTSTQGFIRGVFRSLFGAGRIDDKVLTPAELAEQALENFRTIQKYKKLLDGAKSEKAKSAIIESAKKELSRNGVIPAPYAIGEKAKLEEKLFPKAPNLLPPASGKSEFVSQPAVQVPPGGFNSPEITPKSVIRQPSTPVKPKPYKEPNYKTPLPRKKNIPKPKPMKI